MSAQNYANHTRREPWFAFVLIPILLVNFALAVRHLWAYPAYTTIMAAIVAFTLLAMLVMIRVYTLKVQDRVIRLEERIRMKELLSPELYPLTDQLTRGQFVALRFASDEELPSLVQHTVAEKLTPKQIKQAVRSWRADHLRV